MADPQLDFAFSIEAGDWGDEERIGTLVARVLNAAAARLAAEEGQPFPPVPVEVSLLFTDDASMAAINGQWRGQPRPTNVLSFPAAAIRPGDRPGPMLGDIILARETIEREAVALGRPFEAHLSHLLVHGFLHLFGYDHMEEAEAARMEGLETGILASLGLSDPYGDDEPDPNE